MSQTQAILFERRSNAVAAVQRGEAAVVVARVNHIPMRTLFSWLARHRAGGWNALRDGARAGRPRKAGPEVARWLYDAITLGDPRQHQFEFCLWTLGVIRGVLKKDKGVEMSKSAISRLLARMGLTPQKPAHRSYKQDAGARAEYLRRTFPKLRRLAKRIGADLPFVDESAVRSDHHRGHTRGRKGVTPVVADSGDRFGLKLISAVCPRGEMRFSVIEGRMNSEGFVAFLEKLRADAGRPIVVVADNASYHDSARVRAFVEENEEIHLAHLPAYSPDLNPDEQVWNHLKQRLGKLSIDCKATMRAATLSIMGMIQAETRLVKSFFRMEGTRYASV